MSFTSNYNAVSVTSTATQIMAANNERKGSIIVNNGSVTIYLGMDASVTSSNGLTLLAGEKFNNSGQNAVWKGNIYGITASSSSDIRYWEFGP